MPIPPLMFERDEIEALAVGARMVEAWAGPALARSAQTALAKIRGAVPAALVPHLDDERVFAPAFRPKASLAAFDLVNAAIRDERRLALRYAAPDGSTSERIIRPLALAFWGKTWTVPAWCELRDDFRSFRLDRIIEARAGDPFPPDATRSFEAFLTRMRAESTGR